MDLGLAGKRALCAGASAGMGKAVALTLAAEGAEMDSLETTLVGPIELMRAVLPGMAARKFGRVVDIRSIGKPLYSAASAISSASRRGSLGTIQSSPITGATRRSAGMFSAPIIASAA